LKHFHILQNKHYRMLTTQNTEICASGTFSWKPIKHLIRPSFDLQFKNISNGDKYTFHFTSGYMIQEDDNKISIINTTSNIHNCSITFDKNKVRLVSRLNTEQMRENCKTFAEELASYVFHPARLERICEAYELELEEYFELV